MSDDNKNPSSTLVGGFTQQEQVAHEHAAPAQQQQVPGQGAPAQQRVPRQAVMPAQQVDEPIAPTEIHPQQVFQQVAPPPPIAQVQYQQPHQQPPQPVQQAMYIPQAQIHQDNGHAPQRTQDGSFFTASLRRVFKLRIDPSEVSLTERAQLDMANIHEPIFQAFLTWRHSLLFIVVLLLVPIVGLNIYEVSQADSYDLPEVIATVQYVQIAIEFFFTVTVIMLLKGWTNWPQQRKRLFVAWLLYFATPFLLQLYPYRTAFDDGTLAQAEGLVMGTIFSVITMLTLAPKAFALLPGILRASIVCKLLFPGSSAPGWLITMLCPIYAILIYILLSMPLQLSGSGLFIGAMIGLIGAQLYLSRQGIKLARPETYEEAFALLSRIRKIYLTLNLIGITFAIIAMFDLFEQLEIPWATILTVALSIGANVLLLTLIATDLLITNLHKANLLANDPSTRQERNEFSQRISIFAQEQRKS